MYIVKRWPLKKLRNNYNTPGWLRHSHEAQTPHGSPSAKLLVMVFRIGPHGTEVEMQALLAVYQMLAFHFSQ